MKKLSFILFALLLLSMQCKQVISSSTEKDRQPQARAGSVQEKIEAAFNELKQIKIMDNSCKQDLTVAGKTESAYSDDFLRRRTGKEVLESMKSSGCGDYAFAFYELLSRSGLNLLLIDSASVTLGALASNDSGHVVVAVLDDSSKKWILADPTEQEIITNDWSKDAKTFYDGRYWIGYCGPLANYPVHNHDELQLFYAKTLASVPREYFNKHITRIDFKIDPSLRSSDGLLLNPRINRMIAEQNTLLSQYNIQPEKSVSVLLVKGENDSQGTLSYTDERGWICTVGLKSACSTGFLDYMQTKISKNN